MFREAKFQISLAEDADHGWRDLVNGVNFRLDEGEPPPLVCLYSGGLDSAAGLLNRLRDGQRRLEWAELVNPLKAA